MHTFNAIAITLHSNQAFLGRGLLLLANVYGVVWAIKTSNENIWFSGDGGYADHFKAIGDRLGPFDFAMMECGRYCVDWFQIHMFPKESIQAALDAKVKVAMPVHWAGFNLSYQHAWFEPAEEFINHAKLQSLKYITPQLGEIFQSSSLSQEWWNLL